MKKVKIFMMLMALCLTFAACGGNTAAETEKQTSEDALQQETTVVTTEETTEEETTMEETTEAGVADDVVCCVLMVSVNPEFSLHLNKEGLVLAVEHLNDDAKQALGGVDVVGMSGDAAMTTLLDAIYAYDSEIFAVDQPKVTIVVEMSEETMPLNQVIFAVDDKVSAFAQEKQIPMGYERRNKPVMEETSTVISDSVDANGNRVVVEEDANGVKWTTVSSGETGQMLELTRVDPDGTITHCDMKTNTTTVTKPDGTTLKQDGVIGKG